MTTAVALNPRLRHALVQLAEMLCEPYTPMEGRAPARLHDVDSHALMRLLNFGYAERVEVNVSGVGRVWRYRATGAGVNALHEQAA
jgi:hypothetical protein